MELHEKTIVLPHSGRATLFVFGDMQWGAEGFNEEMWKEFETDFKSTKNAYAYGLGDYDDFVRWTVRRPMIAACDGDGSIRKQLDEMVFKRIDMLVEKMSFMKDRIVGLHSGHHEFDFSSGISSTQLLCHRLKAKHLGWSAFTVLKVKAPNEKGGGAAMKIFSTHGSGGSMFSSADMGNLEKKIAPYWVADLYLRGHSSKLEMIPMELNDVTVRGVPRLVKKTRWLVNVGGFMEGYISGPHASYVERNTMPPACLGYAKCEIEYSTGIIGPDGGRTTGIRIQPMLRSPRVIAG